MKVQISATWSLACLLAASLLWSSDLPSDSDSPTEEQAEPEPLGISNLKQADYAIASLVVPGRIEEWTSIGRPGTDPIIALISRSSSTNQDSSLELSIWRLGSDPSWETLAVEIPEEIDALESLDLDSDGRFEVLLYSEDRLVVLDSNGDRSAELDVHSGLFSIPRSRWADAAQLGYTTVYRRLGRLESVVTTADWTSFESRWKVQLPIGVDRVWAGLTLETPPVIELRSQGDKTVRYVVGPQAQGAYRLRTMFVDVPVEGDPQTMELWSMFSNSESVQQSWYVIFNGQPALLVTTVLADKHGVFEKKKLRLFLLEADRSRSGSGPILEVMTRSRNWYDTCAGVVDVSGDGLDDIVSAEPQGLGAGKLWVTAHPYRADGTFEQKAPGTMLQVSEIDHCEIDYDFDRNGKPDLLAVEGDSILIYPLLERASKNSVVDLTPKWEIDLSDIRGRPRSIHLFPDDRPQIVSTGRTEADQGRISVVRFD